LNMSALRQQVRFDLSRLGFGQGALKTLIASRSSAKGNEVTLAPFGLLIAEVNQ
jgi:hypothetical protein